MTPLTLANTCVKLKLIAFRAERSECTGSARAAMTAARRVARVAGKATVVAVMTVAAVMVAVAWGVAMVAAAQREVAATTAAPD